MEILSIMINVFAALGTMVASWAAIRALLVQTSPDIIMFIAPDSTLPTSARLIIRNNGDAPAYDVRFNLAENMFPSKTPFYEIASNVFNKGYAILPPKCDRDIYLGSFEQLDSIWGDTVYEVEVFLFKEMEEKEAKYDMPCGDGLI